MFWLALGVAAVAAYLAGSFPAGFLAGFMCGKDLRKEGSGNVGATNALRVLGKGWGYAVFAADFLKGVAGVKAAQAVAAWAAPEHAALFGVVGAVCAVLGHNFPVWLGFVGGKGISTSGGIILALFPLPVFGAGFVFWLAVFFATRYVSLASLAAAVSLPVSSAVLWWMGRCEALLVGAAAVMCALAVWRHRPNIARLMAGTEKRFERKRKDSQPSAGSS